MGGCRTWRKVRKCHVLCFAGATDMMYKENLVPIGGYCVELPQSLFFVPKAGVGVQEPGGRGK